ncbi:conserved hypothetical protein [delta proteobacterium NaphS2]|nr:conserved hypothetical protein [delta proteobacterium NaphS2]
MSNHRQKSLELPSETFCLSLADGETWVFCANDETLEWTNRFCKIIGLTNGAKVPHNYRRFIVIRTKRDSADSESSMLIEDTGFFGASAGLAWEPIRMGPVRFFYHPNGRDVICDIKDTMNWDIEIMRMQQSLYPIFRTAQVKGGLPFHASLIEKNGGGFLFAASGGGGKSTCASRAKPPWRTLCDDSALIVKQNGSYFAHPFPTWSTFFKKNEEPECNSQYSVPVKAVFFLQKASHDGIIPLGASAAAAKSAESAWQAYYNHTLCLSNADKRKLRLEIFQNALEMAKTIPMFILRISISGCFWGEIDKVFE